MDALRVQNQIRHNAEEVGSFFSDLAKWEKEIKVKDKNLREGKGIKGRKPIRRGAGTVQVSTGPSPVSHSNTSGTAGSVDRVTSAAKHTYDIGYKKWEKFDEDSLETVSKDDAGIISKESLKDSDLSTLTPATIINSTSQPEVSKAEIPRAQGTASNRDIELYERERGNAEFKAGNFTAAVKCYTKCLGLKQHNYIAFSNRAMAYLKLHDNVKAEIDCTSALRIEATHVKSLLRRATARNALGKHRAAVLDLRTAASIDPTNKQVAQELKKSLDLLKSAVTRAPMVQLKTAWVSDGDADTAADAELKSVDLLAGPDLPHPLDKSNNNLSSSVESLSTKSSDVVVPPEAAETVNDVQTDSQVDADADYVKLSVPEQHTPTESNEPVVSTSSSDGTIEHTSKTSKISKVNTLSSAPAKTKCSKHSSGGKKKKSSMSHGGTKSNANVCYGIERSLVSLRGNDKLLSDYLVTLDPNTVFPDPSTSAASGGTVLEADVIVDLLLSVSKCIGGMRSDWDTVLQWFESVQRIPSFGFVKSLFSQKQAKELSDALNQAYVHSNSDDYLRRIDNIKVAFS
eukprot:CAMPEP_0185033398 /NCGR_PEP_ID=MMETSP1103-20130426/22309_1 /TAXON_ID=36769 /ORGANISM="Paraphysomonas bandaiensis, Strain Caron Lab Isolate" /LENGTH=570 /DNA_ID=CAMNT_0027569655 /DNA_START=49 /DNA_END=1758 /DNA_ORIENTATION=-